MTDDEDDLEAVIAERDRIATERDSLRADMEVARALLAYALSGVLDMCGNSYANKTTEEWLVHAKRLGVYKGPTIGTIQEIREEWEADGDLPEWPKP